MSFSPNFTVATLVDDSIDAPYLALEGENEPAATLDIYVGLTYKGTLHTASIHITQSDTWQINVLQGEPAFVKGDEILPIGFAIGDPGTPPVIWSGTELGNVARPLIIG
jgi:hypothetical protein